MKLTGKDIAYNAIIAASYVALTLVLTPISFGVIQFRFAEILVLLCFFRKNSIIGITLGTIIANIASPMGIVDICFGTLASVLSCILVMYSRRLLIACLFPVLINGLVVGAELYFILNEPFWMSFLTVSLGELTVLLAGYILFLILKRAKVIQKYFSDSKNVDFKW